MTKKLKKTTAFLSAVAMVMAMLLYFPSGMFSNIDWGLKASAEEITPTEPSTEDSVYQITNAAELYWFAELVNGTLDGVTSNSSASAKLMNDITVNEDLLASLEYDSEGNVSNGASFTSWTPIGFSRSMKYFGSFDGNGKTVSGLFFDNSTTDYVGLFGYIGSGKVTGVKVADSYIRGKDYVGGVCGFLSGEMTGCYNTGSVSGNNTVGGVCGENHSTIKNCYNLGDVSGTLYVGGVCGWTDSGSKTVNCYSLGGVSGSSYVGGVCGVNCGALANCYFNSTNYKGEAIGNDSSGNSVNVSGKAAASFTSGEVAYLLSQGHTVDETVYDGSVWGQNIETETYPVLNGTKVYRNEVYSDCVGLTYVYANEAAEAVHVDHFFEKGICLFCGKIQPYAPQQDSEGVYQITNAAELYWFAGLVNGTLDGVRQNSSASAILMNDITVNENLLASLEYDADGNVTNGESFTSWTPIGDLDYDYNGTFNGNGKTISGLFCDNSTTDYVGLFGYIGSGKVTDVKVADSYIRGKNSVGGVCGKNVSGEITNCGNSGKVVGTEYVGGVCGYNNVGISGCHNTGSVSGNDNVGGVCGTVDGEALNCYNTGDISGKGMKIGGVCGSTGGANAKITNCYNTGTIIASGEYVGGVCGFLMGEMTGCYNTGSVIRSGTEVGGVCGYNDGTIKNCYNLGDISGTTYVGGVCGITDVSSMTVNCYSLGGVSGSSNVGGVCGYNSGALANCYFNSINYTGEAIGYDYSKNTVNVSGKAAAQFNSGEVAYLLSQGCTVGGTIYNGDVWGQDLSVKNSYPVLGGKKVLANSDQSAFANDIIIYGQNAALDGTIDFNIFVAADDNYEWSAKIDGAEVTKPEKNADGLYAFTFKVAAKDMAKDIEFYINENVKATVSVKAYLEKLKKSSESGSQTEETEKIVALANAMETYGTAANAFFNSGTVAAPTEEVTAADLEEYGFTKGEMPEGISYYGSSLILKSETTVRHYFQLAEGKSIDDFEFTVNDSPVDLKVKETNPGYCYIDIENISADKLGEKHTVTVKAKDSTESPSEVIKDYCALSYANTVLEKSDDENLQNLVKTLYLYNQKANVYSTTGGGN